MPTSRNLRNWKHHLQDEADAAFLYRQLVEAEKDPARRDLYQRLAKVEDKHVSQWQQLLRDAGESDTQTPPPSARARLIAWMARRFGPRWLAPSLLAEEAREVKGYLKLANEMDEPKGRAMARSIARESAHHTAALSEMLGRSGEPWHAVGSSGVIRSIVYGFNDGLTANFGLVAGVLGASVEPHTLLVTGVAGTVADALSMGASGYLAAKSQAEVYLHEIEMEREEIQLMPETEAEELALIYEAKGMRAADAQVAARTMLNDPDRMLKEKIRAELDISPATLSPLKDGVLTGTATALGALIPVFPFFLLPFEAAIWMAFGVSMTAHFAVGAARSLFTGRGLFRSGLDMFLVGLGVAGIGYLLGDLLTRVLLR